jgi:ABC-type multidrug transport system ATPase subunit
MKMLIGISTPTSGEAGSWIWRKERYWNGEEKYRLYEQKFSMYDDLTVKRISLFGEFTV